MGVRRFGRLIGRLLALGLGVWLATTVALSLTIWLWPRDQPLPAAGDAIICLGAGMSATGAGDQPDAASDRRARSCAALYAAGVAPVVVFTGAGPDVHSVAQAMYETAVAQGLPPEAGVVEPEAQSTIQNADFSLALLPDASRIIVVSDRFHLPRSWLIFRVIGDAQVAVHAADLIEDAPDTRGGHSMTAWILRETLAVWFNAARALSYVAGGLVGVEHETRIGWFN